MKTLLLSSTDIAAIVRRVGIDRLMDDCISEIRDTCRGYSPSRFSIPTRSGFSYNDEHQGLVEWMPVIRYTDRVVMKLVGYHPNNPSAQNVPTVLSTALVFDTKNGHVTDILDATFLTSVRTGAASAVASSILAVDQAAVVGVIGAGAQSVTQLHALSRTFEVEEILASDVDRATADSLEARLMRAGVSAKVRSTSVAELVAVSDILCTATSIDVGAGPLFERLPYKKHLHVNAVGSDFPGKTELSAEFLRSGLVCPDFREQAKLEGECQLLRDDEIGPDLLTLVKNSSEMARHKDSLTIFDSTGWALEDLVAVGILTSLARELGIGEEIDFECIGDAPKDPYEFLDTRADIVDRASRRSLRRA